MLMVDKCHKYNNVYIKNFGEEIDDDKLRELFEQYGKIISAKVMYDGHGKSRGFGFVNFEETVDAEKAVTAMNGQEMGGKHIYCGHAQEKAERQAELKEKFKKIKLERINRYQGVNLYVKNLDAGVDDDKLRKEFSQFGTITSAKVMVQGGRSRGFGFVCFSSPEATKAVTEMNGRVIVEKPLYVALAQRKEDRQAHLASQHIQRLASMRQQNLAGASCVAVMAGMTRPPGAGAIPQQARLGSYQTTRPQMAGQSYRFMQQVPRMSQQDDAMLLPQAEPCALFNLL